MIDHTIKEGSIAFPNSRFTITTTFPELESPYISYMFVKSTDGNTTFCNIEYFDESGPKWFDNVEVPIDRLTTNIDIFFNVEAIHNERDKKSIKHLAKVL